MFKAPGPKVLEIGCGTGHYTSWLVQKGYEVTAVDISGEMMALALEEKQEGNPGFVVVRWCKDQA